MEISIANHRFISAGMLRATPKEIAAPTKTEKAYKTWLDVGLEQCATGAVGRLAARLGTSDSNVSKARSPATNRKLQVGWLPIIRQFFVDEHVQIEEPAPPVRPPAHGQYEGASGTRVVGYVGAGAAGHYFNYAQPDFEQVEPPLAGDGEIVAVKIVGESLGMIFRNGYAFYRELRRPPTDDMLGRLCVVGLANDQILIKRVQRGKHGNGYDLFAENEDPIRNAEIEWAAIVEAVAPGKAN
jgi:hypothetical protein